MKDLKDNLTRDLIDAPRRGRPVTGKAKTKAQTQKDYRDRKKADGDLVLRFSLADQALILDALLRIFVVDGDPALLVIARRFERVPECPTDALGPILCHPAKVDPFED